MTVIYGVRRVWYDTNGYQETEIIDTGSPIFYETREQAEAARALHEGEYRSRLEQSAQKAFDRAMEKWERSVKEFEALLEANLRTPQERPKPPQMTRSRPEYSFEIVEGRLL